MKDLDLNAENLTAFDIYESFADILRNPEDKEELWRVYDQYKNDLTDQELVEHLLAFLQADAIM